MRTVARYCTGLMTVKKFTPLSVVVPVHWQIYLQSGKLRRTVVVYEIIEYVWDDSF